MLVSQCISLAQGLLEGTPIGGFSWLQAAQAVIDETYAMDSAIHFRQYGYIETVDAQLEYTFDELFGSDEPKIRFIKGLYRPALPTEETLQYGNPYQPIASDQRDPKKRIYASSLQVYVDGLRRLVTFLENPGATTDVWKLDYYIAAPIVVESTVLPILKGWEMRFFIPGLLSYFELSRDGKFGTNRMAFDAQIVFYKDALENHTQNRTEYDSIRGYQNQSFVIPQ